MAAHGAIQAIEQLANRDIIARLAKVGASEVRGLSKMDRSMAAKVLFIELQKVFVVTERVSELLLEFVQDALAYARITYASSNQFLKRVYGQPVAIDSFKVRMLTGPSGTGKSALLAALARVFGEPQKIAVPGHTNLPLELYHLLRVESKSTFERVFQAMGKDEGAPLGGSVVDQASRWRHTVGTCLSSVDELQFLTQSKSANTLIAKVLLGLTYLPMPIIVASNYSLLHRVMSRPPEEHQRYLGQPTVLSPDPPESACWIAVLSEYQTVAGEVLGFRLSDEALRLWNLTVGSKRILIHLLVTTYARCRDCNRNVISMEDVTAAYRSTEFFVFRKQVEDTITYAITGQTTQRDLKCPLPLTTLDVQQHHKTIQEAARKEKVAEAARVQVLTLPERNVLAACEKAESEPKEQPKGLSRARRPARTVSALQEAGRTPFPKSG